jgi:hypothetical protein
MSAAKILSGEIESLMLFRSGDSFTIALPTNADAGVDFGIVRYLVRRVGDCVEAIPCDVMGIPLEPEAAPEDGAEEVPHGR